MKCALCGYTFDDEAAASGCKGCVLVRRCRLLRCPNCGFEMPREPAWLAKILRRPTRKERS